MLRGWMDREAGERQEGRLLGFGHGMESRKIDGGEDCRDVVSWEAGMGSDGLTCVTWEEFWYVSIDLNLLTIYFSHVGVSKNCSIFLL